MRLSLQTLVRRFKEIMLKNKRGQSQGLITAIIGGVIGLVIFVIVGFVIVSTVLDANLLGSGAENTSAYDLSSNLTAGVNQVASRIPTILGIAAIILLFGILVVLMARSRQMGIGGGSL